MTINQNKLEDGAHIYEEYTDQSGLVVRHVLRTRNTALAFQVGQYRNRPMRIPVYNQVTKKVSHHRDGDEIQVFHLHGIGKTKEEAVTRACNKLIRLEMAGKA